MESKFSKFVDITPIHTPVTPFCEYFGRCGGCLLQHLSYEEQLEKKSFYLSKLYGQEVPIKPAPQTFGYRNRMDFVTAFGKVGLRKRGSFDRIIDIHTCPLINDGANRALRTFRMLWEESPLEDYNLHTHKGFLRYLSLRTTRDQQVMAVFTTDMPAGNEEILFKELVSHFLDEVDPVSCWWIINDTWGDRTEGRPKLYWANPYITETLSGKKFLSGPLTFFQNNTVMAEQCFQMITRFCTGNRILDLYCGVGAISISISDCAREVCGVEKVPETIRLAEENARLNQISNVRFVCDESRTFLSNSEKGYDTIIVDPPRSGIGKKVMIRIQRAEPERIIYMSCNPKTQVADLRFLRGYTIKALQAFDMFPQTSHIEMIVVLDHQ